MVVVVVMVVAGEQIEIYLITARNHLMEQDMTGRNIDDNCTVSFIFLLVD